MRICCLCWLRKTKEKTSSPKLLSYKFKKDEFLHLNQPPTLSTNFTTTEYKSHYKSPSCASSCNFNFKSVLNWSHCLDLVLNGLLTRRNFWRIPGLLGNYTIPKWKEFLKSREPILRKSYLSIFIHINKHMDGAGDIFWIKSVNGTFLALQIKSFGQKKFWFSCRGKKVPFWQFLRILKNCQNGTF